jgi:hypothetical protein
MHISYDPQRANAGLHIVNSDVLFFHGDGVAIRYRAEGVHAGEAHGEIQPTGRKAQWTAAALFGSETLTHYTSFEKA